MRGRNSGAKRRSNQPVQIRQTGGERNREKTHQDYKDEINREMSKAKKRSGRSPNLAAKTRRKQGARSSELEIQQERGPLNSRDSSQLSRTPSPPNSEAPRNSCSLSGGIATCARRARPSNPTRNRLTHHNKQHARNADERGGGARKRTFRGLRRRRRRRRRVGKKRWFGLG